MQPGCSEKDEEGGTGEERSRFFKSILFVVCGVYIIPFTFPLASRHEPSSQLLEQGTAAS